MCLLATLCQKYRFMCVIKIVGIIYFSYTSTLSHKHVLLLLLFIWDPRLAGQVQLKLGPLFGVAVYGNMRSHYPVLFSSSYSLPPLSLISLSLTPPPRLSSLVTSLIDFMTH